MNAENIDQIYSNPIFLLLVGLVLLSILATFILPLILKIGKLRFSLSYNFKRIKRNLLLGIVVGGVIVIFIGGVIFVYFASRPTVVTAEEFRQSNGEALEKLESIQTKEVSEKGSIYLLDIRDNEDFIISHIGGSFNSRPEDFSPAKSDDKPLAVYSSKDEFDEAYQTARSYKRSNFRNLFTDVYVIEDGFEGLFGAGLEIRMGRLGEEIKLTTVPPKVGVSGIIDKIDRKKKIITLSTQDPEIEQKIQVKFDSSTKVVVVYPPSIFDSDTMNFEVKKTVADLAPLQKVSVSTKDDLTKVSPARAALIQIYSPL